MSAHLCPTLCDPMDCSLPGSSLPWKFPRQEYWSELPFPSPGDLSNPGIEPTSPVSFARAGKFFTAEPPGKPAGQGLALLCASASQQATQLSLI